MCFLNTRPAPYNAALTQALRASGVRTIELPLLEFETLPQETSQLAAVQNMNIIVVVSPTAARLGLEALNRLGYHSHPQTLWIAVGSGTQSVLQQMGITANRPELENSEGILRLAQVEALQAGARVMVWRGEGGRELLQAEFLARSVELMSLTLYRRCKPATLVAQWQQLKQQQPRWILISSELSWQHWCALVTPQSVSQFHYLVLGARLAALLRNQQINPVCVLESLQADHVINVVKQLDISNQDRPLNV